ncbi:MAG: hypothetical protein JXN62_01690 [Bacteroidales bacterium]|nr:hypothetical protein [Bacteroidales bacterium]
MSAAGFCLAVTWLTSAILFRKGTDFRIQRVFIIMAVILSLLLPLSRFSIEMPDSGRTTTELPFAMLKPSTDTGTLPFIPEEPEFIFSAAGYLVSLYYIIIAIWLSALFIQLARIFFLYSVSDRQRRGSLTVLTSSRIKTPLSFFRMVFIPGIIGDEAERESIIIHESIHASQSHSLDNLFIEMLTAVMWFNPFVWMIRRSLHLVHEYLADEGTLSAGIDRIRYQALLINQVVEERLICLSSDFNNKLLKKRMIMMTKSNQKKEGAVRLTAFLPLGILMFVAVSILNGFFPRETKASDQGGLAIAVAEPVTLVQPLSIQQDTSAFSKIKVTGYGGKESQIRVEKNSSLQDTTGTTRIRVIGYGKQKAEGGSSPLRIENKAGDGTASGPVFVVDGVHRDEIDDLDHEEISSVEVHKEDNLIIVRTKKFAGSKSRNDEVMTVPESSSENILYLIDGEKSEKEALENINPSDIENITVLKDKESVKIYASEDVDGVIIIKTK